MCQLAQFYEYGYGAVERDDAKAVEWYEKTLEADDENVEAMVELGAFFKNGEGAEKDEARAEELFGRAAELLLAWEAGDELDISDKRTLGMLYLNGHGVEQDYERAAELLAGAAGDNDREAMYMLGLCYLAGQGVEQNTEKALELLTGAAEQGEYYAMEILGMAYERGKVVDKDLDMARQFYEQAAASGLDRAAQRLADLAAEPAGE